METAMTKEEVKSIRDQLSATADKLFNLIGGIKDDIAAGNNERTHLNGRIDVLHTKVDNLHAEHGKLSKAILAQGSALQKHMDSEDGLRNKILIGLIAFLGASCIGLVVYIWRLQIG